MWLDIVALILLGVFIGMGCLRGALVSFFGLAAFVVAYAASFAAAPVLAPWLGLSAGTPAILGVALAGAIVFAVVYLAVVIVGRLARRAQRERSGTGHSVRDRFFGGVFGAVRGAFVVALVSWLVLWLDALRVTGGTAVVPEIAGSTAAHATSALVEAGVAAALSDSGPAGSFAARFAARPALAVEDLQQVLANPRFEALREDAAFWSHVEAGSVDVAMGRVSFRDFAQDGDLRQELVSLGLIEPAAANSPEVFEAAAADALRQVGPRLRALREDPALRELMEDPEIAAMVRSGDHLGLLTQPAFRQLVSRAASATP